MTKRYHLVPVATQVTLCKIDASQDPEFARRAAKKAKETRRSIGKKLHELRVRHQIPLEKLAKRAGINPRRLDYFEMGKMDIKVPDFTRLAMAYQIDPIIFMALMSAPPTKKPC